MVADRLVGPALACSALVFLATADMNRLAAILTVDFGTGPRVSAPTTVLASMNAAARRGILIKGGAHLEKLARVSTVIFDKTGTLTRGVPEVTDLLVHDAGSRSTRRRASRRRRRRGRRTRSTRRCSASRRASASRCRSGRTRSPSSVGASRPGAGAGRAARQRPLPRGARRRLSPRCRLAGGSTATRNRSCSSRWTATHRDVRLPRRDPPREPRSIRELRARGVDDIVMFTGDGGAVARQVGEGDRDHRFFAEMLPADKAEMAQRLSAARAGRRGRRRRDQPLPGALVRRHRHLGLRGRGDRAGEPPRRC